MKYLRTDYKTNIYFYLSVFKIIFKTVLYRGLQIFLSSGSLGRMSWWKWRCRNKHNQIFLFNYKKVSVGDAQKISIGKSSYGQIDPIFFGTPNEGVIIGNYVSIASVKLLCGGNHPYKGFSTFPYKVKHFGEKVEATCKGPIVIKDDVWIGEDVLILSGVTIGQGAIVAAGSVVTKSVDPYSIVGGNPAKFIKYRFDKTVRTRMMDFNFTELTVEGITKNRDILYAELTVENVDSILGKIRG